MFRRFLLRISFKLLSYEYLDSLLRFLDLYSSLISEEQLKLTVSQNLDRIYLTKFCANIELPFLLR